MLPNQRDDTGGVKKTLKSFFDGADDKGSRDNKGRESPSKDLLTLPNPNQLSLDSFSLAQKTQKVYDDLEKIYLLGFKDIVDHLGELKQELEAAHATGIRLENEIGNLEIELLNRSRELAGSSGRLKEKESMLQVATEEDQTLKASWETISKQRNVVLSHVQRGLSAWAQALQPVVDKGSSRGGRDGDDNDAGDGVAISPDGSVAAAQTGPAADSPKTIASPSSQFSSPTKLPPSQQENKTFTPKMRGSSVDIVQNALSELTAATVALGTHTAKWIVVAAQGGQRTPSQTSVRRRMRRVLTVWRLLLCQTIARRESNSARLRCKEAELFYSWRYQSQRNSVYEQASSNLTQLNNEARTKKFWLAWVQRTRQRLAFQKAADSFQKLRGKTILLTKLSSWRRILLSRRMIRGSRTWAILQLRRRRLRQHFTAWASMSTTNELSHILSVVAEQKMEKNIVEDNLAKCLAERVTLFSSLSCTTKVDLEKDSNGGPFVTMETTTFSSASPSFHSPSNSDMTATNETMKNGPGKNEEAPVTTTETIRVPARIVALSCRTQNARRLLLLSTISRWRAKINVEAGLRKSLAIRRTTSEAAATTRKMMEGFGRALSQSLSRGLLVVRAVHILCGWKSTAIKYRRARLLGENLQYERTQMASRKMLLAWMAIGKKQRLIQVMKRSRERSNRDLITAGEGRQRARQVHPSTFSSSSSSSSKKSITTATAADRVRRLAVAVCPFSRARLRSAWRRWLRVDREMSAEARRTARQAWEAAKNDLAATASQAGRREESLLRTAYERWRRRMITVALVVRRRSCSRAMSSCRECSNGGGGNAVTASSKSSRKCTNRGPQPKQLQQARDWNRKKTVMSVFRGWFSRMAVQRSYSHEPQCARIKAQIEAAEKENERLENEIHAKRSSLVGHRRCRERQLKLLEDANRLDREAGQMKTVYETLRNDIARGKETLAESLEHNIKLRMALKENDGDNPK
eukprot:jgi/Bigna1/127294/aug1.4_g2002